MKLFGLAYSNIKKGKSAAISLFILIFIAALLLTIGMTLLTQMSSFYDNKVADLQDPHAAIILDSSSYKPSYEHFIKNYSGIEKTEKEDILLLTTAKIKYGDSEMSSGVAIASIDHARSFPSMNLIEKLDSTTDSDIYMPYNFKASGGYSLGDTFNIHYQNSNYSYRVAGFFEATMLGGNNMSIIKFLLPQLAYDTLHEKLGEQVNGILISVIFKDSSQSSSFINDYKKLISNLEVSAQSPYFWEIDIETVKSVNTMTINLIATILVAFSIVIVLVSLIVIKFRVTNSIDDGMINIGVLKAIGYTSKQILLSILLQFMLITIFAGVLGTISSYVIMPVFGKMITSLSGLIWIQKFSPALNLFSIFVVAVLVLIVVLFSSLRIHKLLPVAALRGGIQTHSFRKNHFPIERTKGGLHFILACKTMIASHKQNVMIALIIAAVSFASIFSAVLYYNIAKDKTAFIHLIGIETSNVHVMVKPGEDMAGLVAELEQMEDVEKVVLLDLIYSKIDGTSFYTEVSDDFSRLINNTVYKGRHPKYDNEISISWLVSQQLNKGIGDTVELEIGGRSYSYLVTGLSQSLNNMGQMTSLTSSGVKHVIPEYEGTVFNIYLNANNNNQFIDKIRTNYGHNIESIIDVDETLKGQTVVYVSTVLAVMTVILTTTALVVALILYLVIKTMILKRKKEFGILKALGYTTFQLMHQISMSFVPVVFAGVILGGVLGIFGTNSLLTFLMSGAGIKNAQFIVNIPLVVVLCLGIILIAYIVSMLVARRIKHISAYSLITE